jgi:YVTN family beta-propeller protein
VVCPCARAARCVAAGAIAAWGGSALIYVTNSAGDSIHVIDPTTNKVGQEIKGIEGAHGLRRSRRLADLCQQ